MLCHRLGSRKVVLRLQGQQFYPQHLRSCRKALSRFLGPCPFSYLVPVAAASTACLQYVLNFFMTFRFTYNNLMYRKSDIM